MDKYTTLVRIWHRGDECYYDAGKNVTMTHLMDYQIEQLIAHGVIEPVPVDKPKKREVKDHGNTDSSEH